jgi:hypothetical protein
MIWGGFEEWSAEIREPLLWAGETDPFTTREAVIEEDPDKDLAVMLLTQLHTTYNGIEFTVQEVLKKASSDLELRGTLMSVSGGGREIDRRRIEQWVRIWRDRFAGSYRLKRANAKDTKPARWKVIREKKADELF